MKKIKKVIPLEIKEQIDYIAWLDAKNIKYFAVPNVVTLAAALRSIQQKVNFWRRRKEEGVKKGVPDLVVFLPKIQLYVEMKRVKLSKTSDEQLEWVETINKYPYAKAVICKGAIAAIEATQELLNEQRSDN